MRFPSQEEIEKKAKEIVRFMTKHLEDLYGMPIDEIRASDTLGEWEDSLSEMTRWIIDNNN